MRRLVTSYVREVYTMEQNTICPICHDDNSCTVNSNPHDCWCMKVSIDEQLRRQLPQTAQCICNRCLQLISAANESL